MLGKQEVRELVEPIIELVNTENKFDFEKRNISIALYDLQLPRGLRGTLRLFICDGEKLKSGKPLGRIFRNSVSYEKKDNSSVVGLGECSKLSRKIIDSEIAEVLLPSKCTLEVSTPGVNRRLTKEEHFKSAIGELVSIELFKGAEVFSNGSLVELENSNSQVKLRGELVEVRDESLVVHPLTQAETKLISSGKEISNKLLTISLTDVQRCKVDFVFL